MKLKSFALAISVAASLSALFANAESAEKTPMIANFDKQLLNTAPEEVIEDAEFMTVVEPKGAKAKGVRVFESSDGKLTADLAEYDKVTLKLKDWPIDEYMYIIEGQLEIRDEKGNSKLYGPGDAFVMPKGFSGTWRVVSKVKKMTVNYAR